MNVLLCDDDLSFMDKLESDLSEYSCHVYKFSSAKQVEKSDVIFDIAFLDIVLENNALVFDIINHIKKKNPKCVIAFFTNHIKYAPQGYEYRAFRYILKTEPPALIKRRISEVFAECERLNATIKGNYKGVWFKIAASEIYYIEIFNHILRIHSTKGEFEMYCQLKEIYPTLQNLGFVRCHRSYVINLSFVRYLEKDSCFILNDPTNSKIPVGISYKAASREKYLNYAGENL